MNPRPAVQLPKNHQLVHDIVREQGVGRHASPGEIFVEAKRRQPGIGYSTVYRALERLRALGLVLEVRVPGAASALYEPARPGHPHLLCERCGELTDVNYALPKPVLDDMARSCGAEVADVTLTLYGVCARCRTDGEAPGR